MLLEYSLQYFEALQLTTFCCQYRHNFKCVCYMTSLLSSFLFSIVFKLAMNPKLGFASGLPDRILSIASSRESPFLEISHAAQRAADREIPRAQWTKHVPPDEMVSSISCNILVKVSERKEALGLSRNSQTTCWMRIDDSWYLLLKMSVAKRIKLCDERTLMTVTLVAGPLPL
mmetsp:Transcript_21546/g.30009  ORF Transcript_21546/g.30009 Transcript_21546/m.30009 type:complete len:173 (+) Transcript_21546:46-564(+)